MNIHQANEKVRLWEIALEYWNQNYNKLLNIGIIIEWKNLYTNKCPIIPKKNHD